jgi:hypothetical protein
VLLFSFVSATAFVASAVAVSVAPPLVAVQVPLTATFAVAPAAIAAVVPLSVVPPTTRRVVDAPAPEMPRLWTATLNETAAPTSGFAGFEVMPATSRSGPGACPTTSWLAEVKVLLPSFCSATVLAGSATAATL